jgi:ribosomal protein S18 acetylase RimI-like enzyme
MTEFRVYEHGSKVYDDAVRLRKAVLRGPLGLTFQPEELAREVSEIHVGAFEGDRLVASLTLTPLGQYVKMRQVAVSPELQGLGLGRGLVLFSEEHAREMGFKTMTLHARETAVSFYTRLGYELVGDSFIEVTIPHREMRKTL